MKIDLGRLTQEETAELAAAALRELTQEQAVAVIYTFLRGDEEILEAVQDALDRGRRLRTDRPR
jgi:hypothetical protein